MATKKSKAIRSKATTRLSAGAPSTEVGLGIELIISDKPVRVEMRDVTNAVKNGFQFCLPAGAEVELGSLTTFYASLRELIKGLPDVNWAGLPEPIGTIAEVIVTIKQFEINTKAGTFKIEVDFTIDKKVLGITVKSAFVIIDRQEAA